MGEMDSWKIPENPFLVGLLPLPYQTAAGIGKRYVKLINFSRKGVLTLLPGNGKEKTGTRSPKVTPGS